MTDEEFSRKLDEIGDTAGPACSCLVTIVLTLPLFAPCSAGEGRLRRYWV